MSQFGRPNQDIHATAGVWSPSTNIYQRVDEVVPNDGIADRVEGTLAFNGTVIGRVELKLSSVSIPGVRTGHILRYRLGEFNIVWGQQNITKLTLIARLKQGSTVIASETRDLSVATLAEECYSSPQADQDNIFAYTFNITEANALNITDYADLRIDLQFELTNGFLCAAATPPNSPTDVTWAYTWAELEVPDPDNDAPTSFLASAVGFYKNDLTWTVPVNPGTTSYIIERGDGPSPGTGFVQVATSTSTTYTDRIAIPVPPGAPPNYCYRVKAIRSTGTSAPSNVSCTTLGQAVGGNVISVACPIKLPYNQETGDSPTYTPQTT